MMNFVQMIEATQEELLSGKARPLPGSPQWAYLEVLKCFLAGDVRALEACVAKLRDDSSDVESQLIYGLSVIRLKAARFEIQVETDQPYFDELIRLAQSRPEYLGELYFVLGNCYEITGRYVEMRDAFVLAARYLQECGAKKKSLKALVNYVAAESRVHPGRKLISDYFFIYKKALRLKVPMAAGVCLMNISREYQKLGAYGAALRFAKRAQASLQHEHGSRPYYLAVVHQAHLLFQLGRIGEAKLLREEALAAGFEEVRSAVEVLAELMGDTVTQLQVNALTPAWRERRKEKTPVKAAPGLEDRLLHALTEGGKTKHELIAELYGDRGDPFSLENRFNNLISRVRKSRPGVILYHDGRYRIADETVLTEQTRQVV